MFVLTAIRFMLILMLDKSAALTSSILNPMKYGEIVLCYFASGATNSYPSLRKPQSFHLKQEIGNFSLRPNRDGQLRHIYYALHQSLTNHIPRNLRSDLGLDVMKKKHGEDLWTVFVQGKWIYLQRKQDRWLFSTQ